jgi:hypothetical protein
MRFAKSKRAGAIPADALLAWETIKEEFFDRVRTVDPRSAKIVADELAKVTEAVGFQVNRVPYEAQQFIHIALATVASLGEALREVQRRGGN